MNNNSSIKSASLSVFITVVMFVLVVIAAPYIIPQRMVHTINYYLIMAIMELVPLSFGVAIYLVVSSQKFAAVINLNPMQAKINRRVIIEHIALAAALAFFGYYIIVFAQLIWLELIQAIGLTPQNITLPPIRSIKGFVYAIIGMALVPAVTEELIFRSILQKELLNHMKPVKAIIISSLMFMLMHGSLESALYTFSLGCLLGYLAYASGSVIPSMIFHFVNNAIAVFVILAQSLLPEYFAEAQTATPSLLSAEVLIILVIAIVCGGICSLFLWLYRKISTLPQTNSEKAKLPRSSKTLLWLSSILLLGLMGISIFYMIAI